MADPADAPLRRTSLFDLHVELGARMVPFAGWEMPIQYEGVKAEHLATRAHAGLFDVSHMGFVEFLGDADTVAGLLERAMPTLLTTLAPGRQRYTFLTNERGGVIDDLMVTRRSGGDAPFSAVFNAANVEADIAHLEQLLADELADGTLSIAWRQDHSIIAVQGPAAVDLVDRSIPGVAAMAFMDVLDTAVDGASLLVSRSGYTGEDGVEIVVPNHAAEALARRLLDAGVTPAGLGARDTLRLEAGLCLHGQDLSPDITPIEADLRWAIPKRRREEGGYPGAEVIAAQSADGPPRVRVGLRAGRRPVRDGAGLRTPAGDPVGVVTSGGFGPTVDAPIAMALVDPAVAEIGTELVADVRGKDEAVTVAPLPFAPHRYAR